MSVRGRRLSQEVDRLGHLAIELSLLFEGMPPGLDPCERSEMTQGEVTSPLRNRTGRRSSPIQDLLDLNLLRKTGALESHLVPGQREDNSILGCCTTEHSLVEVIGRYLGRRTEKGYFEKAGT